MSKQTKEKSEAKKDLWMSPKEVAEKSAIKLTAGVLGNWRCQGVGPPYRRIVGKIFYVESELMEWAESQKVTPGQ